MSKMTMTSVRRHLKGFGGSIGIRSLCTQIRDVVARFNEFVTRRLLEGALVTFKKYDVNEEDIDVVWVPGSFEIGTVAEKLEKSGKYQAVLCIGAIRGDTSHYDAVVNSAASDVLSAGLNSGVPCVFGVLTCDDMDQAVNRAGGRAGNKGSEAALTAIEMASLFQHYLNQLYTLIYDAPLQARTLFRSLSYLHHCRVCNIHPLLHVSVCVSAQSTKI